MLEKPQADELAVIRVLLEACLLPYLDLAPQHLEHFLTYKTDQGIAGVVGLEINGEAALLRSLAVAPRFRGQGVGCRLVEEIEAYAGEHGVKDIYLLTTTAADYFAGRGYRAIARSKAPAEIQATEEFTSICPDSAVCMYKAVS
ncbi:MAG: GNAT family N-acetyltransferase [Anaerolineales bacterium]|nr:GNAT family N-acetyltransferase [Anaerolineales bacterium]